MFWRVMHTYKKNYKKAQTPTHRKCVSTHPLLPVLAVSLRLRLLTCCAVLCRKKKKKKDGWVSDEMSLVVPYQQIYSPHPWGLALTPAHQYSGGCRDHNSCGNNFSAPPKSTGRLGFTVLSPEPQNLLLPPLDQDFNQSSFCSEHSRVCSWSFKSHLKIDSMDSSSDASSIFPNGQCYREAIAT